MRELSFDEIDVVSGGEYTLIGGGWTTIFMSQGEYVRDMLNAAAEFYTTGHMPDLPPPPTNVNVYWEFGASLGIGFGLYGDNENFGISFNAGVGVYGTLGISPDSNDGNSVGNNGWLGSLNDFSFPKSITIDQNGRVSVDPIKFAFGVIARESDRIQ